MGRRMEGGRAVYGKIFKSIYYGSLAEDQDARDMFICLCAHADSDGYVDMTLVSVGLVLRWDQARAARAAEILLSPDPNSATDEAEGRRILAKGMTARGIKIVNYLKYRRMQTDEDRRAYHQTYYETVTKAKRRKESTGVNNRQGASTDSRQGEGEVDSRSSSSEVFESSNLSRLPTHAQSAVALQLESPPSQDSMTEEEAFEQVFWPEYPRRVGKAEALREFLGIFKKMPDAEADVLFDRLMSGLRRDIANEWKGRELDKVPHARTWLHNRRWEA